MKTFKYTMMALFIIASTTAFSQSEIDKMLIEISTAPSAERIEKDVVKLVGFGTRHTLSDTISKTRGIGAARRWVKSSFDNVSKNCNNCIEVSYLGDLVKADGSRIITDTKVVNVMAIQRGTAYPNRYVMMTGDIDSRVSDVNNFTSDAPGANDNATGLAGTIEAARVLSKYKFPVSIIYVGLSGEEQGLYGGKILAKYAKEKGWDIIAVLNNDMIGNIEGINGVIDNSTFRVFSEAISVNTTEKERNSLRFYGGEVDGTSRQLARYIDKLTEQYMTNLDAIMIYRLDRFGRGGHHRPFNDEGFTGVRIMEMNENYNRQHQDTRVENGIKYGDVLEGVNFDYAAKLTAVNCLTLASLAAAPLEPTNVMIAGAVEPSTRLKWDKVDDENSIGYKIYWRDTTSPQWQYSRFVGKTTDYTLKNIVIDNYLFGVVSVGKNGAESLVQFPRKLIPSGI
ncbi:MAG: M28 family metallopeptidase [Lutibacter sp.]|jgi:Zn-dependent M28 family amino/carboxypeptidase